ncbi:hypothetical protein [Bergeyella zoohelcum]|uniref:Uncharacterized protein n=2 Tax=Bergeyella zoohelcum TaxID=1015 RepID=A0A7Z8YP01_9FLAO|nr:hypothetical protein [Bergeyella zoohelcum]VDH04706.1 Uncharacterised protein [Bergeyella zoohelcum]
MNKTTIKISVLAFLGFMTYGYAQQQQQDPYKGKVGVNTITPSATMDIRPSTANAQKEATTNEGIIAPKLSKTRIANIETPVEGTLVYATDATYTAGSDATVNNRVAKITEKGYYFYNGTEWMKAGNNSLAVDGSKWTNDTANNVVKLTNLSDGTTPRTDDKNVFVNNEGDLAIGKGNFNYNASITINKTQDKQPYIALTDGISGNDIHAINGGKAAYGAAIISDLRSNGSGSLFIDAHTGGGLGGEENAYIHFRGGHGENEKASSRVIMSLGTLTGRVGIGTFTPSEKLDVYKGDIQISGYNDGEWTDAIQIKQGNDYVYFKANPEKRMFFGNSSNQGYVFANGNVGIGTFTPSEKLDVAGNIKSSSLASTGNRHVYADANGVLKIGTTDVTTLASLWTEDVTNNSIKLAVNSDGSTRSNTVSILDDGKVHASSFMGANGATIFPDYVFQKYYTGTSSIKADYNFKSLSQVEDFVKTNGHLPGYKSAETIKAQGYVDLMETQLTNVEKIEELYLHSIEQDKALKAKDAEIADLKQRLERLEKLIK